MTSKNANAVRAWLMTGDAGMFEGASPHDVLSKAWGGSGGLNMSLGSFTDCLHAQSFKPYQLGSQWVLALPDRPNR